MDYNLISNVESCHILIPQLLYYSHWPSILISLFFGCFVFFKSNKSLTGKILLSISTSYSLWAICSMIVWVTFDSTVYSFFWSFFEILSILFYFLVLYFGYVFIEEKDVSSKIKLAFLVLFLPVAAISSTKYYLVGFHAASCDAIMNDKFLYYVYFLKGLAFVGTMLLLFAKYWKYRKDEIKKPKIIILGIGLILLLSSFLVTQYFGDFVSAGLYKMEFYGLFAVDVFIGFLAYLIVRYKAFNIKLIAAQALVVSIIVLIASQFAFIQNSTNRILTGITLAIVSTFGWWLVKSVKIVDEQREQLVVANEQLERLDKAKNEFINIASHQLRTPITVIKGVISMLQDGTMDKFDAPTKAKFIEGANAKCKKLEEIINGILNATSLTNKKLSVMDSEAEKINVKDFITGIVDGFKTETVNRQITLTIAELDSAVPEIYGQKQYLEEAFSNLISNAIKYTPSPNQTDDVRNSRKGEAKIIISNKRDGDFVTFSVKDNGIGIPPEAIPQLFKKFSRAKNAMDMYIDGTGLGLFIIKEIAEGHGGTAWVESELGKGSEFFIKIPIHPGNRVNVKQYIQERAETKM